jgi:hypothetical protein
MSFKEPLHPSPILHPSSKDVRYLKVGLIVLMSTVVIFFVGKSYPFFMQKWYLRGLFQAWRLAYDFTLGLLPFPPALLLLGFFIWRFLRSWRSRIAWKLRGLRILVGLVWSLNLFMWLWGFHYASAPLVAKVSASPSHSQLFEWALEVQQRLNSTSSMELIDMPEDEVRIRLEAFLMSKNWPVLGRVRARAWHDGGFIRYAGISGIYLPWFMEGHTSVRHPSAVLSFIRTHEMAHGYGISGEGEADYCAYMALKMPMGNDWDQQAFWMADYELWCKLRSMLANSSELFVQRLNEQMNTALMVTHQKVKDDDQKYRTASSKVAAISNDIYLKSMGIKDGIANYDQMVALVWQDLHP